MKILVIDDDPAILELVAQYLSLSAQYEVRTEHSARDALAAIGQDDTPFDCFLVDIQMPGVDGITLVEFVREHAAYRHTPIIMLTAMEDKAHVDRAFAAGATDYITKPFDFYDLQLRISAAREAAETKIGAPAGDAADADGQDQPGAVRLEDPISLPDVEGAIDYADFENYVRQLLNRRLYRVSAIAVKIGGVEQIHEQFSPEGYQAVIRKVAAEVRAGLLAVGGILTYRGNGVFLCVPDQRLQGRRNAMQKALNKRHRVMHPKLGRIPSSLYVGDQIPLGTGNKTGVLAALDLAVESVEKQTPGFGEFIGASKRFLHRDRGPEESESWEDTAGEPLA